MRDFLVSLLWPSINTFYAPNFEKVGDILVSARPYCPYVSHSPKMGTITKISCLQKK